MLKIESPYAQGAEMEPLQTTFEEGRFKLKGALNRVTLQALLASQESPFLAWPAERAEAQLQGLHKWMRVVIDALAPSSHERARKAFEVDARQVTQADSVGWVALHQMLEFLARSLAPRRVHLLPLSPPLQSWMELYGGSASLQPFLLQPLLPSISSTEI